jgi:hypothetical protein
MSRKGARQGSTSFSPRRSVLWRDNRFKFEPHFECEADRDETERSVGNAACERASLLVPILIVVQRPLIGSRLYDDRPTGDHGGSARQVELQVQCVFTRLQVGQG